MFIGLESHPITDKKKRDNKLYNKDYSNNNSNDNNDKSIFIHNTTIERPPFSLRRAKDQRPVVDGDQNGDPKPHESPRLQLRPRLQRANDHQGRAHRSFGHRNGGHFESLGGDTGTGLRRTRRLSQDGQRADVPHEMSQQQPRNF